MAKKVNSDAIDELVKKEFETFFPLNGLRTIQNRFIEKYGSYVHHASTNNKGFLRFLRLKMTTPIYSTITFTCTSNGRNGIAEMDLYPTLPYFYYACLNGTKYPLYALLTDDRKSVDVFLKVENLWGGRDDLTVTSLMIPEDGWGGGLDDEPTIEVTWDSTHFSTINDIWTEYGNTTPMPTDGLNQHDEYIGDYDTVETANFWFLPFSEMPTSFKTIHAVNAEYSVYDGEKNEISTTYVNKNSLNSETVNVFATSGETPTLGESIEADDITEWSDGELATHSVTEGCLVITSGTKPKLTYTSKTIPNVVSVGSMPTSVEKTVLTQIQD